MSYHGSCSKCGNQGWIPSSLDGLCVDCREYKKVLCDHCKKNITTGASHARNGVIICHGCWLRLTNDSKGAEMIEHWEIGLFADGSFKLYRAEGSGPWECVHEGTIGAHRSRPGKAVVRKNKALKGEYNCSLKAANGNVLFHGHGWDTMEGVENAIAAVQNTKFIIEEKE